jgi:hypothetical protein
VSSSNDPNLTVRGTAFGLSECVLCELVVGIAQRPLNEAAALTGGLTAQGRFDELDLT